MPFTQPTAREGPELDVPHTLVNFLEPDVLAGTADGAVNPLAIPPNASIGRACSLQRPKLFLPYTRIKSYAVLESSV